MLMCICEKFCKKIEVIIIFNVKVKDMITSLFCLARTCKTLILGLAIIFMYANRALIDSTEQNTLRQLNVQLNENIEITSPH